MSEDGAPEAEAVDPVEFLRRALQISPEDAAQVREDAAKRDREPEDAAAHEDDRG